MIQFTYVEMRCLVDQRQDDTGFPIGGLTVEPLESANPSDLYDCYASSFEAGDAFFFQYQPEGERRRYFEQDLGFPQVLSNPASFLLRQGAEIIAFTLVLACPEDNYHISCMCVLPEYQDHGLGRAMLNRIKGIAFDNGARLITLGTEPTMKAFQLYSENGFTVFDEHVVEIPDLDPDVDLS
ncbi:MAG: GNAT family N-acetyltransferase [Anaerolineales bacterium]|jgi:ribosomal protein S18 acetylase RimI-like enzyme